jgi:hypothetical protein
VLVISAGICIEQDHEEVNNCTQRYGCHCQGKPFLSATQLAAAGGHGQFLIWALAVAYGRGYKLH